MDIPFLTWYPAIQKRRSYRSYDANHEIPEDKLGALDEVCRRFIPFPGARSQLVYKPPADIFKGIIGSYGKIKGSQGFIAFIGKMDSPSIHEEVGYTGEGIILEAVSLGLDTCWVGGFFSRKRVSSIIELSPEEKVLAVTPVGYAQKAEDFENKVMTGFGRTHNRLSLNRLLGKGPVKLPQWVESALEAARIAPSAINRQPWGFDIDESGITVFVRSKGPDFNVSKRLDCGIAMLHLEVAARFSGIQGKCEFQKPPLVAKYKVSGIPGSAIRG